MTAVGSKYVATFLYCRPTLAPGDLAMPSFAQNLEPRSTMRSPAQPRRHEYATLEHLLLALIDDEDAAAVMNSCDVDMEELGNVARQYLDQEYQSLKTDDEADPQPTAGFQRVVQRAILHVQSSGKDTVTGANVLVALFSERDSYAVYFLQQQDMSRLDAVSFISHGIGKGGQRPEGGAAQGEDVRAGEKDIRATPRKRPRSISLPSISITRRMQARSIR